MLNIRLSRVGKRNHAQYKLVVAEKTAPIKGKFVEQLGSYDPHTKELVSKDERIKYWISKGAGCSETVHNLLIKKGIIEGKKIKLTLKSKKSEEDDSGKDKADDNKKDVSKEIEDSEDVKADNKENDKEADNDKSQADSPVK